MIMFFKNERCIKYVFLKRWYPFCSNKIWYNLWFLWPWILHLKHISKVLFLRKLSNTNLPNPSSIPRFSGGCTNEVHIYIYSLSQFIQYILFLSLSLAFTHIQWIALSPNLVKYGQFFSFSQLQTNEE